MRAEIPALFGVGFGAGAVNFLSVGTDGQLLSHNSVDDIFVEVLTELGVPTKDLPMEYLYNVYNKAFALKRTVLKKDPLYEQKAAVASTVVSYCAAYGLVCFQIPEMVLNNDLAKTIDLFIARNNTHLLLADIIHKANEDDAVLDVLNVIFPSLSVKLYLLDLDSPEYSNYLSLWETLVALKPVSSVFSTVAGFSPPDATQGLDFEQKTLLGSLLRLSPLNLKTAATYFRSGDANATVINYSSAELLNLYSTVQNEYKVVFDRIWFITDKLIRGSPRTRNDLMKWFADLVNVSHLRTGSHSDPKKLASDGFMFNISYLLIRLSMPFLDYPSYTKLGKIDPDYFGPKNKLIAVDEEPRLFASAKEAEEFYGESMEEESNFISDCFYLTLTYLEYGIGGMSTNYDKYKRQVRSVQQRIRLEQETLQQNNRMLRQYNGFVNTLKASIHAIEAFAFNRNLNMEIFDFIVGASQFMARIIDPQRKHPFPKLSIPIFEIEKVAQLDDREFLKTKAPEPWKYFPEFCVEGMVNYCKFISGFNMNPMMNNEEKLSVFAEFATTLLRCPELIGNPHMKGSIVEIFFFGCIRNQYGQPGYLANVFGTNQLIQNNLLYSLLDIYVTIEKTGTSSQFYDKFNSRYHISKIIEELWENPFYKRQLSGYSRSNVDFFIRFIARMLNDTTYLFDEAFNELNSIHNMQEELKKREGGAEANESEFGTTEELQENLLSSELKAKSYVGLANQTMMLFTLFTEQVPEGFTIGELVDRLAGMLDYNLSLMVGPKCSNLKVKEPEKYDFDPKKILAGICQVYCNLSKEKKFIQAVAKDGRSFNFKYFQRAKDILEKRTATSQAVLDTFYKFGQDAEQERLAIEQDEAEMGEVPDEYLDPLMYTLMEDPVILPGSKVTMDRSTIKAHLLSDPTDPFNRMPLKLEDVVDDVELRAKIQAFKRGEK